jgi:hypothetical protein
MGSEYVRRIVKLESGAGSGTETKVRRLVEGFKDWQVDLTPETRAEIERAIRSGRVTEGEDGKPPMAWENWQTLFANEGPRATQFANEFHDHSTYCRESLMVETEDRKVIPMVLSPGQLRLREVLRFSFAC